MIKPKLQYQLILMKDDFKCEHMLNFNYSKISQEKNLFCWFLGIVSIQTSFAAEQFLRTWIVSSYSWPQKEHEQSWQFFS